MVPTDFFCSSSSLMWFVVVYTCTYTASGETWVKSLKRCSWFSCSLWLCCQWQMALHIFIAVITCTGRLAFSLCLHFLRSLIKPLLAYMKCLCPGARLVSPRWRLRIELCLVNRAHNGFWQTWLGTNKKLVTVILATLRNNRLYLCRSSLNTSLSEINEQLCRGDSNGKQRERERDEWGREKVGETVRRRERASNVNMMTVKAGWGISKANRAQEKQERTEEGRRVGLYTVYIYIYFFFWIYYVLLSILLSGLLVWWVQDTHIYSVT